MLNSVVVFSIFINKLYAEFSLNSNQLLYNPPIFSFLGNISEDFYNNLVAENRFILILNGLRTTIIIFILAVLLGTMLGSLSCWMRLPKNKVFQILSRIYISILSGTPVLVLLMIIFYVVFASINIDAIWIAVIGFGLNFGTYSSEIFRNGNGIESVPVGQHEASIALGFSKVQTFWFVVLPQTVKRITTRVKRGIITLVK
ncbi:MAG: ABC transporter permease subunit [Candidatus Cloacimonadota bacterium]|nr:ABC transporter permease subunit [Candidatus Cloacimonadota bacterium]